MTEILFVCQVFHPDTQSTSQLFSSLLAQLGAKYRLKVVAGYPGRAAADRPPNSEVWRGVRIVRGGSKARFKRGYLRRIWAYLSYSLFVSRVVIAAPKGTKVFVATNPPFAPVLVAALCGIRRLEWRAILLDVFPDGIVAIGGLSARNPIVKLWEIANRIAFRAAGEVWVLGRDMKALIESKYRVRAEKVHVVPHWSPVEPSASIAAEQSRLWTRLGLDEGFIVQYSGNMGLWHDLETIVHAAARVVAQNIHFLFIGDGVGRDGGERLARSLQLKNITWLPYQDRDSLTDSLSCCHAALISQRPGLEGVAVPCKLYGILAVGRAVIAQVPDGSEVACVVREEACGVVVRPGDAEALAAEISRLAGDREAALAMGRRAFDAYREKYRLARAVSQFDHRWSGWAPSTARAAE